MCATLAILIRILNKRSGTPVQYRPRWIFGAVTSSIPRISSCYPTEAQPRRFSLKGFESWCARLAVLIHRRTGRQTSSIPALGSLTQVAAMFADDQHWSRALDEKGSDRIIESHQQLISRFIADVLVCRKKCRPLILRLIHAVFRHHEAHPFAGEVEVRIHLRFYTNTCSTIYKYYHVPHVDITTV